MTYVFKSPGPLYGKVQKITKTENGTTITLYHASYNEQGQLFRAIDKNGFVTTYTYDRQGKIKSKSTVLSQDPELRSRLGEQEKLLLTDVYNAPTASKHDNALEKLAFFYLNRMADYSKAQALVPQIWNKNTAFNVTYNVICDNANLTLPEKKAQLASLISVYPEKQLFLAKFAK